MKMLPLVVNVTYGNAICMQLYVYMLSSVLNAGVIFLNMEFVSNRLESLCVQCGSVYCTCCNEFHWFNFQTQSTFYNFF